MSLYADLLNQLYSGYSPYNYVNVSDSDFGYPHTNIDVNVVEVLIKEFNPTSWLEIGSMLGNSAIKVADVAKSIGSDMDIVCVDPFTGDVNMWAWEHNLLMKNGWRFLKIVNGKPSIYDRFLANVKSAGHDSRIIPIPCTSIVGIKLLARLHSELRINELPSVIYLDSAHEAEETYLEVKKCWEFIPEGGILFGDDWDWPAVSYDVCSFFDGVEGNTDNKNKLIKAKTPTNVIGPIVLYENQWVVCK